jgi:hypothetical protein
MALAPLATVADMEARGVTVASGEDVFLATALDSASTVVREAAGSPISEATSTVELEGEPVSRLRLPGLPVRSVSEVLLDGSPVTDWRLRSGALWRAGGWSPGCAPSAVSVTYVHGLPEVPSDIVDLVCRMAGQALLAFRENEDALAALADKPLSQERIGDWSATYTFAPEYSVMELPGKMRSRLAARFGGNLAAVRSR